MEQPDNRFPGISGASLYMPRPRVSLEDWCEWTGGPTDKMKAVVGHGFRFPDCQEDTYTMAANAVLRLIRDYDIDPGRVGMLALGTESSKDNSAGAVIVRGMVDHALDQLDRPRLSRDCEVPEFKHACLGGVYALKSAVRYTRTDGADRCAIVVCSDIAEYERGSSGEQTQGAGAVAMLIEDRPRLLEMRLDQAGSASDYRGPDFRKPLRRHFLEGYSGDVNRFHDFPVFSGRYSTFAYLDETLWAVRAMARRSGRRMSELLDDTAAMFFHRPYHLMPKQGLAFLRVAALAEENPDAAELVEACEQAGVTPAQVASELDRRPDLYSDLRADGRPVEPYPAASAAASALRRTEAFRAYAADKLNLGAEATKEMGNLYSASLPAWLAAGLEEAWREGRELSGSEVLAVGYGSGDAAEAVPMRVAPEWREAAARLNVTSALADPVDLTREQYEALHDGRQSHPLTDGPPDGFVIARTGNVQDADFQDFGVDYYRFAATAQ